MTKSNAPKVEWGRYDAVLFDLDGVLTDTASIHSRCWKQTFDAFLEGRAVASGEPFRPFDIEADYRRYVDGKPRYDGVRDFLASRDIALPEGERDDPPGHESVCGVGNGKAVLVNRAIAEEGVVPYPGSVALVRSLRGAGMKTAVVSSSANCADVLRAAKIDDLFDARVDGSNAGERGLAGKPAPDTFLAAASDLGTEASRAVVVEDAISGVESGRAGGFGLVVGVARHDDVEELARHGADVVVSDLGELVPETAASP